MFASAHEARVNIIILIQRAVRLMVALIPEPNQMMAFNFK